MTEFWKSRNKYLCTYCNIYIADDAPSRQQHESGLKHIGSRDRYVRDIYKSGERAKKELEEEKREMQKGVAVSTLSLTITHKPKT